jgi:putative transcriptional regulator
MYYLPVLYFQILRITVLLSPAIESYYMAKEVIHNCIRELRFKANEMTQQDLADSVGITRQTVIALEKGRYYPSLELAFLIAKSFEKPLEDVFQFEG